MAHPFSGSWGYQVTSYYAPTPRFGSPDDFRAFVDRMHQHGIGVLLDWVPAHFPRDAWALARFDGSALYEHEDPRRGSHPDWGTLVFNFGRSEVRNFLIANALFWAREFHADGIRVDAVASMLYLDYSRRPGEWVPNQFGGREDLEAVAFLKELNEVLHRDEPGVVSAAEESTAWPGVSRPTYLGGLGFGFKWNMGWMHDTLGYFQQDPIHRRYHHHELTFSLVYAFTENFILPLSHDEVVHGKGSLIDKMPGDRWQKLANLRSLYAFMWAHPGKKLLFMGQEFAQSAEWSHDRSLDWHLLEHGEHAGVQALVRDLNRTLKATPALYEVDFDGRGFYWIEPNDADANVVAFARAGEDPAQDVLVCVCNLSPVPRPGYRLGLPRAGRWVEALNTDSSFYGGTDTGNLGGVEAEPLPWHDQPSSAEVTLPPLGVLWLVPAERLEPVRPVPVARAPAR
jgi:1,4-alpha-glucan branching enzyme